MNERNQTRTALAIPLAAGLLALPLALTLALASTSPAQARQGGYHGPRHHGSGGLFFRADTDRNREITSAEWQALLGQLDEDGDGVVDEGALWRRPGDEAKAGDASPRGPRRSGRDGKSYAGKGLDQDGDGRLEITEIQAVFDKLDADGNGTLAGDELPGRDARGPHHGHHGHRGHRGPMPGLLLLKSADADGDGQVTQAEWQARLAAADTDGNGELSHEELVALRPEGAPAPPQRPAGAGRGLSLERLNELFDRFDDNDDGVVAADEMPRHPRFGGPDSEN